THDYSLPTDGSKRQPEPQLTVESKPAPEATRAQKPRAAEAPTAAPITTPEPEQFALLKAIPPPPIKAPEETEITPPPIVAESNPPAESERKPDLPASDFQAQKEETRIKGGLTNRGPSAVNAVGTPLG